MHGGALAGMRFAKINFLLPGVGGEGMGEGVYLQKTKFHYIDERVEGGGGGGYGLEARSLNLSAPTPPTHLHTVVDMFV